MKRRRLSADEERLWRKVTDDIRPFGALGQAASDPAEESRGMPVAEGGASRSPAVSTSKTVASRQALAPPPTRKAQRARPLPAITAWATGDPARDKLIASRRIAIDRTLDLHGLTQAEALPRLTAFVTNAQAEGCRCVLIITGKGASGPGPGRAWARRHEETPSRPGILRERVREWVDTPLLRPLVARLSSARQKDGGEGAYYLHLKLRRR